MAKKVASREASRGGSLGGLRGMTYLSSGRKAGGDVGRGTERGAGLGGVTTPGCCLGLLSQGQELTQEVSLITAIAHRRAKRS